MGNFFYEARDSLLIHSLPNATLVIDIQHSCSHVSCHLACPLAHCVALVFLLSHVGLLTIGSLTLVTEPQTQVPVREGQAVVCLPALLAHPGEPWKDRPR